MTAPDGWYVANRETAKAISDEGVKLFDGGDPEGSSTLAAARTNYGEIFQIFQHAPGSPVDSNPSLTGFYEYVKASPGVKSGSDYFFQVKKHMAQSRGIEYEYLGDFKICQIDGKEFTQMDLRMRTDSVMCDQSYFASRRGDFIVMIVQTYTSEAERAAAGAVMDTIKLAW